MHRRKTKIARSLASYTPTIAALVAVLAIGIVADVKTRELACQVQREAAAQHLGSLKSRIEDATETQVNFLTRLTGALALETALSQGDLERAARTAALDEDTILGLGLLPVGDGTLLTEGLVPSPERLTAILRQSDPARNGAQHLPGATPQSLAIWSPVYREGPSGTKVVWAQAVIVIDAQKLFRKAGLSNASDQYHLMLSEHAPTEPGHLRGVILGNAGLGSEDPVRTPIRMPGGDWTLEIIPEGGWAVSSAAVLPVRGLTLLSAGGLGWLMLRIRRLSEQRRQSFSELKRQERELSEAGQRLELALRSSRIGVFDYNVTTGDLIWDDTIRTHFDAPRDQEIVGYNHWSERVHPEDRASVEARVWEAIDRQASFSASYRTLDLRGEVRHMESVGACVEGQDGTLRLIGFNRDVTEAVESRRELERRQQAFDAAAESRARVFAMMSHEIRTPLSGILGILDLMRAGPLEPVQRDRAGLVHGAARQLHAIVSDCLDLSTLQAAQMTFHPAAVDVREMAAEVISLLSATRAGNGVSCAMVASDRVPARVSCDPMRLRQVLTNLVGNAVRYTDEGTIMLRLDYDPDGPGTLLLAIEDTGIGIAPEDLPTIFERFVRAGDATARRRGGTGLGLAICKEIVTGMGGEIAVRSALGVGTTFELRLPAPDLRPDVEAPPAPGGIPRAPGATGDSGLREGSPAPAARALVALDPRMDRQLAAQCLGLAGFDAVQAANGADLVDALRSGAWDLVLLDLDHPLVDAIAIATLIRRLPAPLGDVAILALAGRTSARLRAACAQAGLGEILHKPLTARSLSAALDGAREGRARTLAAGDGACRREETCRPAPRAAAGMSRCGQDTDDLVAQS
jgi:signal transduction histidine kinase/CheY-like chemotaxis protein